MTNKNSKQGCILFYPRANQEIQTRLPSSNLRLQRTVSPGGWPEDTQIPVFQGGLYLNSLGTAVTFKLFFFFSKVIIFPIQCFSHLAVNDILPSLTCFSLSQKTGSACVPSEYQLFPPAFVDQVNQVKRSHDCAAPQPS